MAEREKMEIKQVTKVANVSVTVGNSEQKFYIDQTQFYEPIRFGLFHEGADRIYPTYTPKPIAVFEGKLVNNETMNYQFDVVTDPEKCAKLEDYEKDAVQKALEILNLDEEIDDIRERYYWKH